MTLKLDNLPRSQPLVDGQGKPLTAFQVWWQNFKTQIERSVNAISDIVDQLSDVVDQITQILIDIGLIQQTAEGALELAESAINPDGTIKSSKVTTESIVIDGVSERYVAQRVSDVSLTTSVEIDVLTLNVTKVEDESDIDIDASVRLESADDIVGELRIYRDAVEIDRFDPFIKGPGGTYRTVLGLPFTESGIVAGTYVYKITFRQLGGLTTLYAKAGTLMRIREMKR